MVSKNSGKFIVTFISLTLAIAFFSPPNSFADAADGGEQVHVLISPVIGYQSIQRTYPFDHNEGMLTYGGRLVIGTYRLAGEFEAQFGSASETFANPNASISSSFTQLRLGARTNVHIIEQIGLIFRAGMQAYHFSNDYVINGVSSSDSPAWMYRPYVGAGVVFELFRSLTLSVEEVYVIDTSWETGFGFRLFI